MINVPRDGQKPRDVIPVEVKVEAGDSVCPREAGINVPLAEVFPRADVRSADAARS